MNYGETEGGILGTKLCPSKFFHFKKTHAILSGFQSFHLSFYVRFIDTCNKS